MSSPQRAGTPDHDQSHSTQSAGPDGLHTLLSASGEEIDGAVVHIDNSTVTIQAPLDSIPASTATLDFILRLNSSSPHLSRDHHVRVSIGGPHTLPAAHASNQPADSNRVSYDRQNVASNATEAHSHISSAAEDVPLQAHGAELSRDDRSSDSTTLTQDVDGGASAALRPDPFARLHAALNADIAEARRNPGSFIATAASSNVDGGDSEARCRSAMASSMVTLIAKGRELAAKRTDDDRPQSIPLTPARLINADTEADMRRFEAQGQSSKPVREATRFLTDNEAKEQECPRHHTPLYLTHACHHCCDSDKEWSCDRTLGCQECRAQGTKCEYFLHGLFTISLDCSTEVVPRFAHDTQSSFWVSTACKQCESASRPCYSIDKACKSCVDHNVAGCKYSVSLQDIAFDGFEVSFDTYK